MNPSTQIAPVSYGRDYDPSYGVDCNTLATLSGVRSDIKDVEAGISHRMAISDTQRQNADLSIHDKVFNTERSVLEAKHASVSETKDSERRMTTLIQEKFCESEKGRLEQEIRFLRDGAAGTALNAALDRQTSILNQILAAVSVA